MDTIDEYIAQFEPALQQRLQAIRAVVHEAAPDATEKISWGMPTFVLHGNLVHFAAAKKHIGLYPGPNAIEAFAQKLADYGTSKGAIRLPSDQPLPLELIGEIVRFCVAQNEREAQAKLLQKKEKAGKKD